jgi:hypothetical protein
VLLPATGGIEIAEVALDRVHILWREHPMLATPAVAATWDGAALKRLPNPIHADLEPTGAEQARY